MNFDRMSLSPLMI